MPALMEHHTEETTMDPKDDTTLQAVLESRDKLQTQVTDLTTANATLNEKLTTAAASLKLFEGMEEMAKLLKLKGAKLELFQTACDALQEKGIDIEDLAQVLKGITPAMWKELESGAEEASESFMAFREIGTPDEINEALDTAKATIEAFTAIGTVEEISEALDKSQETIQKYLSCGTIKHLESMQEAYEAAETASAESKKLEMVESFSKKFRVPLETVSELCENVGADPEALEQVLGTISKNRLTRPVAGGRESLNEGVEGGSKPASLAPRASRLMGVGTR